VPHGNRFKLGWTRDRVVEAVTAWAAAYGKPPTSTEWDRRADELQGRVRFAEAQIAADPGAYLK
jgi:hypothetical protein